MQTMLVVRTGGSRIIQILGKFSYFPDFREKTLLLPQIGKVECFYSERPFNFFQNGGKTVLLSRIGISLIISVLVVYKKLVGSCGLFTEITQWCGGASKTIQLQSPGGSRNN